MLFYVFLNRLIGSIIQLLPRLPSALPGFQSLASRIIDEVDYGNLALADVDNVLVNVQGSASCLFIVLIGNGNRAIINNADVWRVAL